MDHEPNPYALASGTTDAAVADGEPSALPTIPSSATIFKYNPHRMAPDDVLATFVGRDALRDQLIAHLRTQRGASSIKHAFLYGPRGIGKTTVLLVLRHSIAAAPGLSAAFDAIQFSEEERRIVNLPSFAVRTLELLAELRPEAKDGLKRARAKPERAFDVLLEVAESHPDRQIVLLVDNFDELVLAITSQRGRKHGADKTQTLEALQTLMAGGRFLVVATALQHPARRERFPGELLARFDPITQLEPLDDAMGFLKKRAVRDRRRGFLESLPKLSARIDGLNRLAAGNPRLLVFLYDCLGDRPLLDLVEIVQRTVDDLTPMYQDVIDRLLNPGQAATLEMLATEGGIGTAKRIAELTFQDSQTVRTFMGDLCALGLVIRPDAVPIPVRDERRAREVVFRTHPPLFQIWYEMRHLGRERGLYLVRFFSLLTEPEEARRVSEELRVGEAPSSVERGLAGLMGDVADLLDPDWEQIRKEHVGDVLAAGGSLGDALAGLDKAIAEENLPTNRKVGLLVVRSGVRLDDGDMDGAEGDLQAAANCVASGPMAETRAKVIVAWSSSHQSKGEFAAAVEQARSAIELCAGHPGHAAKAIQASAILSMAGAYKSQSEYDLATEAVDQAESMLGEAVTSRFMRRIASLRGHLLLAIADYAGAREYYEQTLEIAQNAGNPQWKASSLGDLGIVCRSLGEYDGAREFHEESLAIKQQIGNKNGQASSLNSLGNVCQSLGEYDRAREFHEKSLAIQQQIGNKSGQASSLNNLASVCGSLGEYDRAREFCEKSLAIQQQIGDKSGQASSLNNLGSVCQSLGEYDRAREFHEKSLAIQQQIGNKSGQASSLNNLGSACGSLGEYDRAREFYEKSLAIQQQIGDKSGQALSLNNLGNVCQSLGEYDRARELHENALAISRRLQHPRQMAMCMTAIGRLARNEGKLKEALSHFREARRLFSSTGARPYARRSALDIAKSLFQLAALAIQGHEPAGAAKLVWEALGLTADAGAQEIVSALATDLLIPCLRESRQSASQLLPLVESAKKSFGEAGGAPESASLEALLRYYESDKSRAALNGLSPGETVAVSAMIDMIERPKHVEARQLLEAGRPTDARKVFEGILDESPKDVEALFNLASALVSQGELDEAEQRLEEVAAQQADFPAAALLSAQIQAQRGQPAEAIDTLHELMTQHPGQAEAHPMLAQLLRAERRFGELAGALAKWRSATENRQQTDALSVRIPEAHLLAGDVARAAAAMPSRELSPQDVPSRVLLGLLRVFLALHDKDADTARSEASALLEFAADAAPGQVRDPLSRELVAQANELLGDREMKFFAGLGRALTQSVDPVGFAEEFLTADEAKALGERVAEEGSLIVEALRNGRIHGFEDLFRTSARSIGPAAGIGALGDAYGKMTPAQQTVLLSVFTEAIRRGRPAETTAALGAVGGNFPSLDAEQRSQCLAAVLDLARNPRREGLSRESAVRQLNILYPNLPDAERPQVRSGLEEIRQDYETPTILEFFNETVPQVNGQEEP